MDFSSAKCALCSNLLYQNKIRSCKWTISVLLYKLCKLITERDHNLLLRLASITQQFLFFSLFIQHHCGATTCISPAALPRQIKHTVASRRGPLHVTVISDPSITRAPHSTGERHYCLQCLQAVTTFSLQSAAPFLSSHRPVICQCALHTPLSLPAGPQPQLRLLQAPGCPAPRAPNTGSRASEGRSRCSPSTVPPCPARWTALGAQREYSQPRTRLTNQPSPSSSRNSPLTATGLLRLGTGNVPPPALFHWLFGFTLCRSICSLACQSITSAARLLPW